MKNIQPLHLILGGCGLAILGSFLPWVSVSFKEAIPGMGTSHSTSGVNYGSRGIFTLLLAGAGIALNYVKVPGKDKLMALIGTICGGLAALIAIISMFGISDAAPVAVLMDSFKVSIGIGLYLVVLGGLAGGFGWFLRFQKIPGPIVPPAAPLPPSPPPPPPPGPPPAL